MSADRVQVEPRALTPRRTEYVVLLDGVPVLHTGGGSQWDWCHATSFADGLRMGLERAIANERPADASDREGDEETFGDDAAVDERVAGDLRAVLVGW